MAKELTLDLLEELLESMDPKEIRAQYGEALKANPACAAMLHTFEHLDDDLAALKAASQPPQPNSREMPEAQIIKPDFSQVKVEIPKSPTKRYGFLQWLVPLAAAIVIGFMVLDQDLTTGQTSPVLPTSADSNAEPTVIKTAAAKEKPAQAAESAAKPKRKQIEADMEITVVEPMPEPIRNVSLGVASEASNDENEDADVSEEEAPQEALALPVVNSRDDNVRSQIRKKEGALSRSQALESPQDMPQSDFESRLSDNMIVSSPIEEEETASKAKTYLGKKLEEKRDRMDSLKKDERNYQFEQWLERYHRAAAMKLGKELDRDVFRLNAMVRWPSIGKSLIPWPNLSLASDLQNGRYELRWQDDSGNSGLIELTLDDDGYATILRAK